MDQAARKHVEKHWAPNQGVKRLLSLPIDLPGFAYNGAIKAGKALRKEVMKIIRQRKGEVMENKEATEKRDSLTQMLLFTDEDGQFMSEMEIENNIISLLLASYVSTSNAVNFFLIHLAELPRIYDEVFKGKKTDFIKVVQTNQYIYGVY
nr:beta-amyrin 28-monooxygenase-like [Coffea arabica]